MVTPQCIHGIDSDSLIAVTLETAGGANSRTPGLESTLGLGSTGGDVRPNMDGDADGGAIFSDAVSTLLLLERRTARISGMPTSKTAAAAM